MIDDPIVEEIRKYRHEHAKRYGFDLRRIAEALRDIERERHISYRVISRDPKFIPTPDTVADDPPEPTRFRF